MEITLPLISFVCLEAELQIAKKTLGCKKQVLWPGCLPKQNNRTFFLDWKTQYCRLCMLLQQISVYGASRLQSNTQHHIFPRLQFMGKLFFCKYFTFRVCFICHLNFYPFEIHRKEFSHRSSRPYNCMNGTAVNLQVSWQPPKWLLRMSRNILRVQKFMLICQTEHVNLCKASDEWKSSCSWLTNFRTPIHDNKLFLDGFHLRKPNLLMRMILSWH